MKKSLSLFAFFLILCSCANKSASSKSSTEDSLYAVQKMDSLVHSIKSPIDSLGIWSIDTYVDEFGAPGDKQFIHGTFYGSFSNSATEDSKLRVSLLIDSENKISMKLFEYDDTNPVKSSIEDGYKIKVKGDSEQPIILRANNYSDRLRLTTKDAIKLSSLLKKGGKLSFYIIEISEYSHSNYTFTIDNTTGFDKALKALKQKK